MKLRENPKDKTLKQEKKVENSLNVLVSLALIKRWIKGDVIIEYNTALKYLIKLKHFNLIAPIRYPAS